MQSTNSIALALKYRPTSFAELVGQHTISQTLSLALDSKHISHAYLFSGLRGSGKTSSARIFARALECENGPTSTPCGTCANCVSALENKHIDIIEMDGASSRGIDDIKKLIEQTKYHPSLGRFKIFIIDEVHMLSKEAFNALLKTLEEPPAFVKFILATTDPLKLPATILSRTQHFRFKQIPHRLVLEHITNILNKESIAFEAQALDMIVRSGAGSLRDTLTLLDQAIIFCKNHIDVAGVTDMLGVIDPKVLEDYFKSILQNDTAKCHTLLQGLLDYECEMILDEMMLFLKDRFFEPNSDFSALVLDRFARILSESKRLLSLNTDGAFVLLLSTMKMQEAMKAKDLESMIEALENDIFNKSAINTTSATNAVPSHNAPALDSAPPMSDSAKFSQLIAKIKDRNAALGAIFENNVHFVSFDERSKVLQWQSQANEADKIELKTYGKIIGSLVAEVFGNGVQIRQVSAESSTAKADSTSPESTPNAPDSIDSISHIESSAPESAQMLDSNTLSAQAAEKQFLAQNKELITAINNSVGIKNVIKQGGE